MRFCSPLVLKSLWQPLLNTTGVRKVLKDWSYYLPREKHCSIQRMRGKRWAHCLSPRTGHTIRLDEPLLRITDVGKAMGTLSSRTGHTTRPERIFAQYNRCRESARHAVFSQELPCHQTGAKPLLSSTESCRESAGHIVCSQERAIPLHLSKLLLSTTDMGKALDKLFVHKNWPHHQAGAKLCLVPQMWGKR